MGRLARTPDFSKGGYYSGARSRAHNALLVGLATAGLNVVALPLFVTSSLALSFTYCAHLLVAASAYRWNTRPSLALGTILGVGEMLLLSPHVSSSELLLVIAVSIAVAFFSLSVGFGRVGRIERDFRQIKFSSEVPKAADRETLLVLIDREISRAKRHRQASSLAVLEMAVLDRAEQAYGRHQTDLLQRQVQAFFLQQFRGSDTVAWLGGAYFAFLFPSTTRTGAEAALDRVMRLVQNIPARAFQHLEPNPRDWRASITEIKGDETDACSALHKATFFLGPAALQRTGLHLHRPEMAG